jgi:Peptidase A4 family
VRSTRKQGQDPVTNSRRGRWARRRPATAGLASLALAMPALAGVTAAGPAAAPVVLSHHTLPRGAQHSDQTWSGYAVTGDKPYMTISGSWTIPAMNCTGGGGDASPWVGIDGWSDNTVEQIGVDLDCRSGAGSYHPWVEMYPAGSQYFSETISAGDTLTASVTVSAGVWTLTESDPGQGWTKTFHKTTKSPPKQASAEAILEDVGGGAVPPVPDFGTVTFSGVTVDGSPLASAGTVHKTTLERGTVRLSSESALSGGGFSVTWLHR